LAPSQIPAALDMLSGEGVSGTQETAFGAAGMFTQIMMDQGAFWRNRETVDVNGVTFAGEPLQYAPSKRSKTADHPVFKEMAPLAPYQSRWRAWLTGFDGSAKLNGEADIGSADLSRNTGGLAGGLDYQFAPDLLAGFAIGGSSSNFSVRDRITSGHLDAAHFGGYGVKTWGWLYAAGALSFSTFRNDTTRSIVGIGPTETATGSFGSNLLSGRVEVGAKQVFGRFAVTPFAAVQVSQLWQNGFTEANPVPVGAADPLGLSYGSTSVTSLPTFLGAQFDTVSFSAMGWRCRRTRGCRGCTSSSPIARSTRPSSRCRGPRSPSMVRARRATPRASRPAASSRSRRTLGCSPASTASSQAAARAMPARAEPGSLGSCRRRSCRASRRDASAG
jgi:uncharacterized protein with beta-barrel porin domain